MYLEHDQHKLDLFIGDDVDLDGQKEVQVWKGQLITMIADFSGTEQQAALQLCSQEDVSLQWDGGVAKFEFEIEVPASMPARRHVAYFQPIAEQPDQTRMSRPEDKLPLSYQVVASDLQLDSVNLKHRAGCFCNTAWHSSRRCRPGEPSGSEGCASTIRVAASVT